MYILFLQLASAHHLMVDPGISSEWKIFNTSYAMYLAVLGSMIHGMTIPASIEVAQRKKGYTKGLFEWLRKAPWSNPAFSGMFLSLLMFGILGGITGVILGTEQLNIIMHNTMYVPGHFHGTVVGGTTLAFMAVTYPLVNLIFRRELILAKWAQWQPYVFALGVTGIALAQMGAGTLGVSRRHWDITFADALFKFEYPAAADVMMALNGIFGVIAGIGGAMYIIVVVGSILVGKRIGDTPEAAPTEPPEAAVAGQYGSAESAAVPGTAVMVAVFFTAFILYYFVNWKYLSEIWPLQ
jgi:cytochrome c oxidase subunit 1